MHSPQHITFKRSLLSLLISSSVALAGCSDNDDDNQVTAPEPAPAPVEATFHDRNDLDIANFRPFAESLMSASVMAFDNNTLPAELKWKLHTYQMILADNKHGQARGAYQLSQMGVPLADIQNLWQDDPTATMTDLAAIAAFEYVQAGATLPNHTTADHHKALRTHFIDVQIAELFTLMSIGSSMAMANTVTAVVTDAETLAWANANLGKLGWTPGIHAGEIEAQRTKPLLGADFDAALAELKATYHPENPMAPPAHFSTDYLSELTQVVVARDVTDSDGDHVEDVHDDLPSDPTEWADTDKDGIGNNADLDDDNDGISDIDEIAAQTSPLRADTDGDGILDGDDDSPLDGLPVFDVAKFDQSYNLGYDMPQGVDAQYYDRHLFDIIWSPRPFHTGMGAMDSLAYVTPGAFTQGEKWQMFTVQQIAQNCIHCTVHGAYGMHTRGYPLEEIVAMWDFERHEGFDNKQLALFRFLRDIGTTPTKLTAGHIEELRRYYTNREIHEIFANTIAAAYLGNVMQSQATVTDNESMLWALENLSEPVGFKANIHSGHPSEQRPHYMDSFFAEVAQNIGNPEFNAGQAWAGGNTPVPIDIDTDGDGVVDVPTVDFNGDGVIDLADVYDGFPNDPTRWADVDRDGIEDSEDDDIDGDGLSNAQELMYGTSLVRADSDMDGVSDPLEIQAGTDPWVKNDYSYLPQ